MRPSAGRGRGPNPAAVFACLFVLAAEVCFGAVYTPIWVSFTVILLVAAGWLLLRTAWRGQAMPVTKLLWPGAGFIGLVLWQGWSGHSVYAFATRTGGVQLIACGVLFYFAFYGFRRSAGVRWMGTAVWLFTGLLAAEAILQYYTAHGWIYWLHNASYGTPVGPYVYHNYYAGSMDLLLPVCIAGAFVRLPRDWSARLRRALPVVLAVISIVMSQSRGGLFALLFEAALAGACWWPQLRAQRRFRRSAIALGLALMAAAGLASWGPMARRLSLLSHGDLSSEERLEMGQACLKIWRDHPWLGTGFGTFATIYPRYESFDNGLTVLNAHDEYAQTLAETGVAGLVLALGFGVLFLGLGWRLRGYAPEPATILAQCAWIGAIGFLFHSAGDFLFHAPANAFLFFLFAGVVAARERSLRHAARRQEDRSAAIAMLQREPLRAE